MKLFNILIYGELFDLSPAYVYVEFLINLHASMMSF